MRRSPDGKPRAIKRVHSARLCTRLGLACKQPVSLQSCPKNAVDAVDQIFRGCLLSSSLLLSRDRRAGHDTATLAAELRTHGACHEHHGQTDVVAVQVY